MFCHATTCSLPCTSLRSCLLLHILAYVTYSIYHTLSCYYLFYPSYLALLLPTLSLMFYSTSSLLCTSLYYYLLLPSHFALLLHAPSFALCLATYLFLCISFYYFNLKCYCHSLPLVALLLDCSRFTLLLTYYELVFFHFFVFCKLKNLEQTWSFKLFQLGKFSFSLILFFFSLSF
jgi:hypothetical protein